MWMPRRIRSSGKRHEAVGDPYLRSRDTPRCRGGKRCQGVLLLPSHVRWVLGVDWGETAGASLTLVGMAGRGEAHAVSSPLPRWAKTPVAAPARAAVSGRGMQGIFA
jgi:hypothetical protein